MTTLSIPQLVLSNAIQQLEKYKLMAEKAIDQIDDDGFFRRADDDANSIAIIMKHIAGNMRSRWHEFLTTDGEKADRSRDKEFEMSESATRTQVIMSWERGWQLLFESLRELSADDLSAIVLIRGDNHIVVEAIMRQLTHYAYHVGQIVMLARNEAGSDWVSLSIPRGESDAFNERFWGTETVSNPVQNTE